MPLLPEDWRSRADVALVFHKFRRTMPMWDVYQQVLRCFEDFHCVVDYISSNKHGINWRSYRRCLPRLTVDFINSLDQFGMASQTPHLDRKQWPYQFQMHILYSNDTDRAYVPIKARGKFYLIADSEPTGGALTPLYEVARRVTRECQPCYGYAFRVSRKVCCAERYVLGLNWVDDPPGQFTDDDLRW